MPTRPLLTLTVLWSAALLGCSGSVVVNDSNGDAGGAPDGGAQPEPQPEPQPQPQKADCLMRLVPEFASGSLQISDDGLSASSSGSSDSVRASASHVGGRWYFEVRIDSMPGGVWWAQNIGIGTQLSISPPMGDPPELGAFLNVNGSLLPFDPEVPFFGEPYGEGDVIGVAADLDAGLVFFSKNGVWMNGANPSAGTGGVDVLVLPGAGSYYPAIGLSEGDAVTADFGERPFASAPPEGYAPFAVGFEVDASGVCLDPGPEGIPAMPAPMQASCSSGDFSSFGAPASSGPELHVIGIYEPSTPGGVVNVHVARQGELVLALATYSEATFQVTADPGATISRIVLSSYDASFVIAPPGVPVDSFVHEINGTYLGIGFTWPATSGGGDTQELIKGVESVTGRELTSFGGCYAGSSFTLTD